MQNNHEAKRADSGQTSGASGLLSEGMMDCYNPWEWPAADGIGGASSATAPLGSHSDAGVATRGAQAGAGAEDLMRYYNSALIQ